MFPHRALSHVSIIPQVVLRKLALTIRLSCLLSRPVLEPPSLALKLSFNQMSALKLSALVLRHVFRSSMSPFKLPNLLLGPVERQHHDPEDLVDRV